MRRYAFFIGLFPILALRLIDKVVLNVTGSSIADKLQGGLLIAYYPLKISGGSISPVAVLLALIGIILISLLALRLIGGKYIERKYGTWDCGFEALNPRMQYSATGYSKPIRIVFRILFRPSREITLTGDHIYHPETIEYTTTSFPLFEKKLYDPIFENAMQFSKWIKFTVQTGSTRSYLLYIFAAILVLMAYNMFV